MSDGTPNISIGSITGGQNNIGKTEIAGNQTQTNHYAFPPASVEAVFDSIGQALSESPELSDNDREQLQSDVIEPLREIASEPEEKQREESTWQKAQQYITQLTPYAPVISKAVYAFGEASLSALATRNPVVSGVLAAIKATSPGVSGAENIA